MRKTIIDLPFEPGVYTEQSARGSKPFWKDSDKVRFRKGLPEKLGGWKAVAGTFKGMNRKFLDWASLDGQIWVALATDSKLYLWQNDQLYDITPLRETGTLTDPFETTNGSREVMVTDANHGAQRGDYVRFDGATAVGGITIDGEYQIKQIVSIDEYIIEHTSAATSTAGPGGGSVDYEYDISVGRGTTSFGTGYGTGTYGQETWNTPRTVTATVIAARTWALENWGEDLIASPRGGAIYWWDKSLGASTRAVALAGSPDRANFVIMNDQSRQLLAFGATDAITEQFDPLLLRWCSVEDFNDWTVTDSNTAGDARVYQGSKFVTAARTRSEIIAFTDKSVHSVRQVGSGEFAVNLVGPAISILGPNAVVSVANRVYFMAEGDFYIYDGIPRPMDCPVRNYVYDNLNTFQKDKVHVGVNSLFSEIWFFYPGKAPDVWVDADFASGLLSDDWGKQSQASGADAYTVAFSPLGYIHLTEGLNFSAYTGAYLLDSASAIVDPDAAEYETTFVLDTAANYLVGMAICVTDLDGSVGSAADDITGIKILVQPSTNYILLRKRGDGDGTLDGAAAQYVLSSLATPVTLTAGRRYGILARRNGATLQVYLWDENSDTTQLVASVTLSADEIAAFTGSKAGVVLQEYGSSATNYLEAAQFQSFRAGRIGSIIDKSQRGATTEINRYAVHNYLTGEWAIGALARTAWADTSKAFDKPYAAGVDGVFFTHEDGVDADTEPMEAFIESHDAEIPDAGEYIMQIDQMIPDFLALRGSVDVTLKGKKYPHNADYTEDGPHTISPSTGKISVRIRGRQVAVRIESDALGDYWRLGTMRARIFPHGKRGNQ